jgi:hypothetical protein
MDKFGSAIYRMNMKLGSKFLNTLRIKTHLLKMLQLVIVVDGATHSQKDGVESNGGSLKGEAELYLKLHGVGVLSVLKCASCA